MIKSHILECFSIGLYGEKCDLPIKISYIFFSIGDLNHRPFVSGEPDIITVSLNGNEDFLILGCDGLWDHVTEVEVACSVYKKIRENSGKFYTFNNSY